MKSFTSIHWVVCSLLCLSIALAGVEAKKTQKTGPKRTKNTDTLGDADLDRGLPNKQPFKGKKDKTDGTRGYGKKGAQKLSTSLHGLLSEVEDIAHTASSSSDGDYPNEGSDHFDVDLLEEEARYVEMQRAKKQQQLFDQAESMSDSSSDSEWKVTPVPHVKTKRQPQRGQRAAVPMAPHINDLDLGPAADATEKQHASRNAAQAGIGAVRPKSSQKGKDKKGRGAPKGKPAFEHVEEQLMGPLDPKGFHSVPAPMTPPPKGFADPPNLKRAMKGKPQAQRQGSKPKGRPKRNEDHPVMDSSDTAPTRQQKGKTGGKGQPTAPRKTKRPKVHMMFEDEPDLQGPIPAQTPPPQKKKKLRRRPKRAEDLVPGGSADEWEQDNAEDRYEVEDIDPDLVDVHTKRPPSKPSEPPRGLKMEQLKEQQALEDLHGKKKKKAAKKAKISKEEAKLLDQERMRQDAINLEKRHLGQRSQPAGQNQQQPGYGQQSPQYYNPPPPPQHQPPQPQYYQPSHPQPGERLQDTNYYQPQQPPQQPPYDPGYQHRQYQQPPPQYPPPQGHGYGPGGGYPPHQQPPPPQQHWAPQQAPPPQHPQQVADDDGENNEVCVNCI